MLLRTSSSPRPLLETAERSYNAIATVLNKPNSPIRIYSPRIQPRAYPRESARRSGRLQTAKNSISICSRLLALSGKGVTPHDVYEWVWNALGTDETYRGMRERRCRCIRINYADAFRFDLYVMPAILWIGTNKAIPCNIPDRDPGCVVSGHTQSGSRMPFFHANHGAATGLRGTGNRQRTALRQQTPRSSHSRSMARLRRSRCSESYRC